MKNLNSQQWFSFQKTHFFVIGLPASAFNEFGMTVKPLRFFTEGVSDRRDLAKAIIRKFRCWTKPQLQRVLSNNRSENEKSAILDELYRRMEASSVTECFPFFQLFFKK